MNNSKNEVKKLNDLLNDVHYLANNEKPSTSKYADIPKTFFDNYKERKKMIVVKKLTIEEHNKIIISLLEDALTEY